MGKKALREFENILDYVLGAIGGYRRGVEPEFIPYGVAMVYEKLEAARKDLEVLGLYEQCRDALARAELIKHGPEHDEEAEMRILNAARAVMDASGSAQAMRKKLREKPSATLDDFKPDPDEWGQEEHQTKL